MGPEFEKGDGRLRPSLQQRLPGAEGPPEERSTAPRHAACGGPIPSSKVPLLIFLRTCVWSDTSKVEAQGVLGVPSGVRLGREDLVGGRPDRYSLQTGLDAV